MATPTTQRSLSATRPGKAFLLVRDGLRRLFGPTGDATRQGLTALGFNSTTSFLAGLALAGLWGTFAKYPELLVLVPPAIGLRGNVFGSLGNRLSTAIHTGTFELTAKPSSVLGQNVMASMVLTLAMSVLLAIGAHFTALLFGLTPAMSTGALILVSVVGGVLASVLVLAATVLLAWVGVRRSWDLDNLVAPSVSTLGDVITVPALWVATVWLADRTNAVSVFGWAAAAVALVLCGLAIRSRGTKLSRIVVESIPVLSIAGLLSGLGGVVVSKQTHALGEFPAILVLMPAFVSSVGALGGILGSRVSTSLHLGVITPTAIPGEAARSDASAVLGLAVPIMVLNAFGSIAVAALAGKVGPGVWQTVVATAIAAALAVTFVVALAYYGTIGAWRIDADPDNYGIPLVSAAVDFVGAAALVLAFAAIGVI